MQGRLRGTNYQTQNKRATDNVTHHMRNTANNYVTYFYGDRCQLDLSWYHSEIYANIESVCCVLGTEFCRSIKLNKSTKKQIHRQIKFVATRGGILGVGVGRELKAASRGYKIPVIHKF